ncbi:MAG: tryptophan 2,3-dioxygenase family protein [Acidobacteriota bacterium]
MSDKPVAYWEYIRVEEILAQQGGLEKNESALANDEVLFIVIHQIEELWMKLVIRELVAARNLFAQEFVPDDAMASAVRGIDRVTEILKHAASHLGLMETMTTRDYLDFRDKLHPASGFQSAQMREMEILLGLEMKDRLALGSESYLQALRHHDGSESPASRRVAARMEDTPSLREAIDSWLHRTPIDGSRPGEPNDEEIVTSFIDRYCEAARTESESLGKTAAGFALTEQDAQRLLDRYAREASGARAHLMAEDVEDEADRPRIRRQRAALLFIESYRELPLLAWPRAVLDAIVALEQAFVMFRQRHARMVERIIGNRTGTGGSAGVAYLDRTALEYRVFRDLWVTRTLLVRKDALPPLRNTSSYGFKVDDSEA